MRNITLIIIISFSYMFVACENKNSIQLKLKYSKEILGLWENNNELGHKLDFNQQGILKLYSENEYIDSLNYSIETSCDGNINTDGTIFLRLEEKGEVGCDIINSINNENSNILSITTEQGKLQTFTKVN